MRSKAILMALLALAFSGVEAVPVSRDQAASAVRAWVRSGRHLGVRHGTEVEKAATLTTDGGKTFYAVKLKGGGTVFTSSDTESEPIVAFTSSSTDFSNIDRKSPLWALLSRDAEVRANIRAYRAREAQKAAGAQKPVVSPRASAQWARLLAKADPARTGATAPRKEDISEINDIRREPLLTTTWSQTTHNDDKALDFAVYIRKKDEETGDESYEPYFGTGIDCYDYYTPVVPCGPYYTNVVEFGGMQLPQIGYVPEHTPCGCTATATSQLMKYFRFPASVEPKEFACAVGNVASNLTTIGGTYAWDKMIDSPKLTPPTEEQCEAIGHLTYDVGVALGSEYTDGNTSALPYNIPKALAYFGYKNAVCYWADRLIDEANAGEKPTGRISSNTGLHNAKVRRNVVYTNLDNKRPVVFGIYGYTSGHVGDSHYWSGHAVVGDGYGFLSSSDEETGAVTNSVEYVHINMGWSGADDAWYNIPEIDAVETGATVEDSGFNFTVMAAAVYNVFSDQTGEIISGRVLDAEGNPVPGIEVTCDELTAVTDEKGIYSLIVPSATNCTVWAFADRDNLEGSATAKVETSAYTMQVGNRWGADIVLELSPYAESVRNARTGVLYGSVDAAYAEAQANDVLEIVALSRIRNRNFSFAKDLTLKAVAANPFTTPVGLPLGGTVGVASGRLTLTDMAFRGGEYTVVSNTFTHEVVKYGNRRSTVVEILDGFDARYWTNYTAYAEMKPISVAAGAQLAVGGLLKVPELAFADDNGFVLKSEIFDFLKLAVPSNERGAKVGTAECDEEDAWFSSTYIVNPDDKFMTAVPSPYPTLAWDLAKVEDFDLVATLKVGGKVYRYTNLDRLLQDAVEDDGEITVCKTTGTFTQPVEISGHALTVVGDGFGTQVGNAGTGARFILRDGASLTVKDLKFVGHEGLSLFLVDGEGAQLTLDQGAWLEGLVGTDGASAAITVKKGTVTMKSGSVIYDCFAAGGGQTGGKGGAVYLDGAGCVLNLDGGTIGYCRATGAGGGVYAHTDSTVNLQGDLLLADNTSGGDSGYLNDDDLYLYVSKTKRATATLVGELTYGANSVGIRYSSNIKASAYGNSAGRQFVDVDCGLSAAEGSVTAFFNDVSPDGFEPKYDMDNEAMVWAAVTPQGPRTEQQPGDVARIVRTDGVTYYFAAVADAFDEVDAEGSVVELLRSCELAENISLKGAATVCRAAEVAEEVTLTRLAACGFVLPVGSELTVSNLTVVGNGGDMGGRNNPQMLFDVRGGSLALEGGAVIRDVSGAYNRSAGAVVVSQNGMFRMESGAQIMNCRNSFVEPGNAVGVGAGLLVDKGVAYLNGGTITGCSSYRAAGVCVGNKGAVYVKGDLKVTGNKTLDGASSDFTIENLESLYLADKLDAGATIGMDVGIFANTNVFGHVAGDCPASVSDQIASAALFFRNSDPTVTGLVVTNGTDGLLVWATSVKTDEEGNSYYEDKDGRRYDVATGSSPGPGPTPPEPPEPLEWTVVTNYPDSTPLAFKSIERISDTEWKLVITNRVRYCNYRILSTTDLKAGFVTTGDWEHVVNEDCAVWTTNVITTGGAWFWRAEGTEGTNMVPPAVEQ